MALRQYPQSMNNIPTIYYTDVDFRHSICRYQPLGQAPIFLLMRCPPCYGNGPDHNRMHNDLNSWRNHFQTYHLQEYGAIKARGYERIIIMGGTRIVGCTDQRYEEIKAKQLLPAVPTTVIQANVAAPREERQALVPVGNAHFIAPREARQALVPVFQPTLCQRLLRSGVPKDVLASIGGVFCIAVGAGTFMWYYGYDGSTLLQYIHKRTWDIYADKIIERALLHEAWNGNCFEGASLLPLIADRCTEVDKLRRIPPWFPTLLKVFGDSQSIWGVASKRSGSRWGCP